jgi:hypothetical protein
MRDVADMDAMRAGLNIAAGRLATRAVALVAGVLRGLR